MVRTQGTTLPSLQHYREKAFWSQGELGTAAGVSRETVNIAEGGQRVRWATARKLAEALGIEVSLLQESQPEVTE